MQHAPKELTVASNVFFNAITTTPEWISNRLYINDIFNVAKQSQIFIKCIWTEHGYGIFSYIFSIEKQKQQQRCIDFAFVSIYTSTEAILIQRIPNSKLWTVQRFWYCNNENFEMKKFRKYLLSHKWCLINLSDFYYIFKYSFILHWKKENISRFFLLQSIVR